MPATPLRHAFGLGRQRGLDNRFDLAQRIGGFASTPRRNLPQPLRACLKKTTAPQGHGLHIDNQLHADLQVRETPRGSQNNAAAQSHLLLRRPMGRQSALELLPVNIRKAHSWAYSGHASALPNPNNKTIDLLDTTLGDCQRDGQEVVICAATVDADTSLHPLTFLHHAPDSRRGANINRSVAFHDQ